MFFCKNLGRNGKLSQNLRFYEGLSLSLCIIQCQIYISIYMHHMCVYMYVRVQSLSCVLLFVTSWTVAHQAPLSMGLLQARILEYIYTILYIVYCVYMHNIYIFKNICMFCMILESCLEFLIAKDDPPQLHLLFPTRQKCL